ncbi:MAG TPA: glycosyltransferase family 1 protein [Myxococcales bacterium]|nr:glycosyltransferase family 1 protein [Myxococcales bacterium]
MENSEEQENRPTANGLAEAMLDFVATEIDALAGRYAPGFRLPKVFAGHVVGQDARSDLAFNLGLLFGSGRKELGGLPLDQTLLNTLLGLDGRNTHTFFSYRAAESLQRLGGYHDNPRLAQLSESELQNLREAFDSSESAPLVREGKLPKNYAVVVARCEHARHQLGLLDDTSLLEELCERSRQLMLPATEGWIDDSNEARGQFDIYTPDIFLFAEPLAERLGKVWEDGLRKVLGDVDSLALPGGAIVWGRSVGALGIAMTIELAAIGTARGLVDNPETWLARAAWSFEELRGWYSNGVIRAHQQRSTMFYRGPDRRLQMGLDILGKLAQAALLLRSVGELRAAKPFDAWQAVDRRIAFATSGRNAAASAWALRSQNMSFVLPLVGGFSSDYLPAPRAPGLFEVPTSGPISMTPVLHVGGKQLVAAGAPTRVEHRPGEIEVEYSGWREPAAGPEQPAALEGTRIARLRVEGRSLWVEEELEIQGDSRTVEAAALQIPELMQRPLDVEFECDTEHRVSRIDVSGLAEYRSFWSEFGAVHQLDFETAQRVRLRWRVTPRLRIKTSAQTHPYNRALYRPIRDRVVTSQASAELPGLPLELDQTDVLHMHWPEWWQGPDLDRNVRALAALRDAGVRIVWTNHNFAPHHFRGEEGRELYRMWAKAADAVIHHTEWGKQKALATYEYGEQTVHRVIPHGHWGDHHALYREVDRVKTEAALGLSPCAIRLGVIGAPRIEKDVQLVLDAFHACAREDLQLFVACISGEDVPDDPRIHAIDSSHEPDHVYQQRLSVIDALVLPFNEGMLMTGTAFDAIGAEKAAIISDWPVLHEVFGEAAIGYGSTRDDLTRCLESLTVEQVAASGRGMQDCKRRTEWAEIAAQTFELLDEVASRSEANC